MSAEEEQHNFIEGVVRLLTSRPQSQVLILVHSPAGLEILSTASDYVFQMGMLQAAVQTIAMRFAQDTQTLVQSGEQKAREQMMEMEMNDKQKGGVN